MLVLLTVITLPRLRFSGLFVHCGDDALFSSEKYNGDSDRMSLDVVCFHEWVYILEIASPDRETLSTKMDSLICGIFSFGSLSVGIKSSRGFSIICGVKSFGEAEVDKNSEIV
ncbi:unnamed protein product [Strongylus vulgaris]|uniref:Uncharacterized protein n=1 Tax=Strongylus vulgaris TaxID=40348 RepID=A0A3P7LDB8_STRVU|nr:unnamed protein product [Strongylus vulgaris]